MGYVNPLEGMFQPLIFRGVSIFPATTGPRLQKTCFVGFTLKDRYLGPRFERPHGQARKPTITRGKLKEQLVDSDS